MLKETIAVLTCILAAFFAVPTAAQAPVNYDIVYVRSPRLGDDTKIQLPEVKDPINVPPGTDLMLLRPDGSEEVLVPGGTGAIVDPYVSFDGKSVYYARFHDMRTEVRNSQRRSATRTGSDIYRIDLETRETVRLTYQEWTPNTGIVPWSDDHLSASEPGRYYLGYGIFNLGPTPLPGNRLMFTSSRNGFLPNKSFTYPNLQLFVMDDDGKNVEQIGHLNLGSALHPTVLSDGRVMFSSYEAQGLRDRRVWSLWAIWPDGRHWQPLMSAFSPAAAFHFQTELSNRELAVVEYYNQNNNGFGTLLAFPPRPPTGAPAFGDPDRRHDSNPRVVQSVTRSKSYPFSPDGLYSLTEFAHGEDKAAARDDSGNYLGKVTHPSGAPDNDVLLVWSSGPANDLNRPVNRPTYDTGLYLLRGGVPVSNPEQLVLIKDTPGYNEMQPRAVVTYAAIYAKAQPDELPWYRNDGGEHPALPAGSPFGLVGSASLYKRNTAPGEGEQGFNGLDPFNTSENGASSNWTRQGADAGRYTDEDIYAVRILAMEPSSHASYGPGIGNSQVRGFFNHATERLRILGEITVRKFDARGEPVRDAKGNPDTSFLAKIPADTPFTFQTLDRDGMVLNMAQTWHQLRPGEVRNNCGGCHAHAQLPADFAATAAADPRYTIPDLATATPILSKSASGEPTLITEATGAIDVEYYRDIKPILQRSCAGCHAKGGDAPMGLVLDDEAIVDDYENTYNRLARDSGAQYGAAPVIPNRQWRQTNASRYVRRFQARRSLLIWKIFGRRLDGWSNSDHPTESVAGDATTLPPGANPNDADLDFTGAIMPPPGSGYPPLSEDEKMLFARWVDLGAPVSVQTGEKVRIGWFADDLRPTLTVSTPRAGRNPGPLRVIRIGAFDYYSGLAVNSLSVTASFAVNGASAGSELGHLFKRGSDFVWTLPLTTAIDALEDAVLTVKVSDQSGNITSVVRHFDVGTQSNRLPAPSGFKVAANR